MSEIVCYDNEGKVFDHFTQWDRNQSIIIRGADVSSVPVLHFYNKNSRTSLVVNPSIQDQSIYAPVPNILLQEPYPIMAHVFYTHEGASKAKYEIRLPVMPKPRPDDLLYTEVISGITYATGSFTTNSSGGHDQYLAFVPDIVVITCGSYNYLGDNVRTDMQFVFYNDTSGTIRQSSAYSYTDKENGYPYINAIIKLVPAGFTVTKVWMTGSSGTTTKTMSNKTFSYTAVKFSK